MFRTDATVEDVTEEKIATFLEDLRGYLKTNNIPQSRLAKGMCLAPSTINQVLKGKYNADVRPIILSMDLWLSRRRESDSQPETSTFVETAVAKLVKSAAQMAITAADAGHDHRIALAWGSAGCGKTLAAQAVAEIFDGILITCGVDVRSPRALMEKIAEQLGIDFSSYQPSRAFGEIVDKLRGSGKLIVVDEIHALLDARDDSAFHILRRLSDQTGCPQLWLSTCDLVKALTARARKREPIEQITRRFGPQYHLTAKLEPGSRPGPGGNRIEPLYSVEEIKAMYAKNELKLTSDAARLLAGICTDRHMGLLGECTKLVAVATGMNRLTAQRRDLTPTMLWEAVTTVHQHSIAVQIRNIEAVREVAHELKLKYA